MKAFTMIGRMFATVLGLSLAAGACAPGEDRPEVAGASQDMSVLTGDGTDGYIYGRVTTEDDEVFEGRLRFGANEEALWSNYFNGFKDDNPWLAHTPADALPGERLTMPILKVSVVWNSDVGRPFMARFGDITRIEADGRDLQVTLKSGTVVHLDRYAADDYADGVRVWDTSRGVMDFDERDVRSIEFLPTPPLGSVPAPLYGTVRTRQGEFTGLVQWDRNATLAADALNGRVGDDDVSLRFDAIRSIERRNSKGAVVTMHDGQEIVLSDTRRDKRANTGMYVDLSLIHISSPRDCS